MDPCPTGGVCSGPKEMDWGSMDWAIRVFGCHSFSPWKACQGRILVLVRARQLQRNKILNHQPFCSKILGQTRIMLSFARKSSRGHTLSTLNWFSTYTIPEGGNIKVAMARAHLITRQGQIYGHDLHANLLLISPTVLLNKGNGILSQVAVLHSSAKAAVLSCHETPLLPHNCLELSQRRLRARHPHGNLIINSHIHLVASIHRTRIKSGHYDGVPDRYCHHIPRRVNREEVVQQPPPRQPCHP